MKMLEAVQHYLHYRQFGQIVAPQTLETLKRRVKLLVMFWLDYEVEDLNKYDVLDLQEDMLNRGCKERYIKEVLTVLRTLLRYCEEERGMQVLDYTKIKLPKAPRKPIISLTEEEVQKMFDNLNPDTITGLRTIALSWLFLESGIRRTECQKLNRNSLDYENFMAEIVGKGGKVRKIKFGKNTVYWIKKYLEARTDNHEALFISHSSCFGSYQPARLASDSIAESYRILSKKVGFEIKAHKLRKTFTTQAFRNKMNIKAISLLLGHESIKTTEKFYLEIDWDWVEQEYKNAPFLQTIG